MGKAVQFDRYGDISELHWVDIPTPQPAPDRVLVEVRAAGINPGEAAIRKGLMKDIYPATFPSGEGSDLAGIVLAVGDKVKDFKPGQEVLGWSDERSSHATHVSVPARQLLPKPASIPWDVAGALYVAGVTAWSAVNALQVHAGETVVVSGAAGGVGSIAVQLLLVRGAKVIAIASERNHEWLRSLGAFPVAHDERTFQRVRDAASGDVQAWLDAFGGGYVKMAVELGVKPSRINTIIDFQGAREFGARTQGLSGAPAREALAQVVELIDQGKLRVFIAATYPMEKVREAYGELEKRRTRGKIVLVN
jgi:NADPH:quinone reductase-like Zn-dependent oxidoreductase